ncbi:hypothetical protein Cob_v011069 [Colletotrichum orbiculare MAFF 240422]|uniref:Heterokaryon incompatibility domain-containing protein n=1 Tax=Colletotrichum orbiculare (strain 104-T / ATCC 96160 / CBS 514.97 / LARS 414 / MAFF 240422) TaxID=1213857 RepID=N4VP53_COLOR|nr:hypothetical protein Cob_v011069 [Colletotrichum orbiculare MAFF 240422]
MDTTLGFEKLAIGSEYRHGELAREQIRLVVLEPGRYYEPLRCRIVTHDRKDAPSYEAVSYTANEQDPTEMMQILPSSTSRDGPATYAITRSTAAVLVALRSPTAPRIFWDDAICVNHLNAAEQRSLVQTRPQIFKSASRVNILLSHDNLEDHTATMEYISRGRFKHTSPAMLSTLRRFFQHPWFSQLSSVQAVSRARTAVVEYKGISAPWSNLALCARMLAIDAPIMSPIRRLRPRGFIDAVPMGELVKAMCEAAACHSRDPRDRVLAFLDFYPNVMSSVQIERYRTSGFVDDGTGARYVGAGRGKGDVVEKGMEATEADSDGENARSTVTKHGNSFETVYTEFAHALLNDVGLDVLSAVQGHTKIKSRGFKRLPSWVPDWSIRGGRTVLAHLPLTDYQAGGHRDKQAFRISQSLRNSAERLETTVVQLGDIEELGQACDVGSTGWENTVFEDWLALTGVRPGCCPSRTLSTFLQCVLGDSGDEFVEERRILSQRLAPRSNRQLGMNGLLAGLDADAVARLQQCCAGRRLFVGTDGIMGLAPSESRAGDMVAVIPGARIPYIFRERSDGGGADVTLIGECFVSGVMKAEAMARGSPFSRRELRIY